jgi:Centromere-binding protein ParB C-terminal
MAQRPERRKSTLGAAHPIEHQNNQAPAAAKQEVMSSTSTDPSPSPAQVQEEPVAEAGAVRVANRAGKPQPKGAFYADEDVLERIRAAWFHTPTTAAEREASFSDFLREAALERMYRREKTYNEGNPFPFVPSGKIARGRR